jgi:Tol biopolymer transport system component
MTARRSITIALVCLLGGVLAAGPAHAAAKTRLVSKTSGGTPANGDSFNPSISSSGRYVAFDSLATNLPGDDSVFDVFVHDRETGKTRLVSKRSDGTPANGGSFDPSISGSGRYVAFDSFATNLPGDDSFTDVFVHDRNTGKTRLVSKRSNGTPANGDSFDPSISGSGRYVAFESNATNLPGDDSFGDVFVHDRETGKTRLVSKRSNGTPANGDSFNPSISSSGRYVAFDSLATNLPGGGGQRRIYLHGPLP